MKITVLWSYKIEDLHGKKILGTLYEKELQKENQQELRLEKLIGN